MLFQLRPSAKDWQVGILFLLLVGNDLYMGEHISFQVRLGEVSFSLSGKAVMK